MTVKELIKQLENLPQDLPVIIPEYDYPNTWAFAYIKSVSRDWLSTDKDSKYRAKDVECALINSGDWFPSPIR